MKKAIILLSGGLDSATCVAMAQAQGFKVYGLSFSYGQRHGAELAAAARVANAMGLVEHKVATIDLGLFGGSALTDGALDVPEANQAAGIPVTYVPARNTIFLSFALAYAEVVGAFDIFIGVNAVDYSGYPDCRPAFVEAFEHLANVATAASTDGSSQFEQGKFTIHAPLIDLTKAEIITQGAALGVDYGQTVSCYDADEHGHACGRCDSCFLRRKGFADAGEVDPTLYKVA